MSQCVPNWDLDHNPVSTKLSGRSLLNSTPPDDPVLDYEVAELTWENGQLAMHGLGQPRVPFKPPPGQQQQPTASATGNWDKLPRGAGTLESIVNQAAAAPPAQRKHQLPPPSPLLTFDDLVPWFDRPGGGAASATMTMDALVPCAAANQDRQKLQEQAVAVPPACVVGSCGGAASAAAPQEDGGRRRSRAVAGSVRVPAREWSQYSMSGSAATAGRPEGADSQQMTADTGEGDGYTSMGSQDNTSSGALPCTGATATATADDYDSVCHSRSQREVGDDDGKVKRNGKSSVSTKRSRAAAIHNQSERKRRDKINQRMKTLQKLVPSSSKTDKASVLDEVIEYLKQLQAQVQMMSRMNMPSMMLPMAMQQQLQMSMMAPMGLGMGMGMGMAGVMDLNALNRPNIPGMPPNATTHMLHPAAAAAPFMPFAAPWDGSSCNGADRLHPISTNTAGAAALGDQLSAFLACQSQPMTLDTYSRMAAMYQQLHQPPASSSKN